jgi:hypothetical protein
LEGPDGDDVNLVGFCENCAAGKQLEEEMKRRGNKTDPARMTQRKTEEVAGGGEQ